MQDISMTKEEITKHKKESYIVRIGSFSPDGTIHLVPVWYAIFEDEICITTLKSTKKARNILARNDVSVLIDQGEQSEFQKLWGIFIQGKAEEVKDETTFNKILAIYGEKYFGKDYANHPGYKMLMSLPGRLVFRIKQEKIITWDYGKMG